MVDLPTPPLPEATATMWRTPGRAGPGRGPPWAPPWGPGAAGRGAGPAPGPRSAVRLARAALTPGTLSTAISAAWRTGSKALASGGAMPIEKTTRPEGSMTISDRRPEAGRLVPAASTVTPASAFSTSSRVIATSSRS